MEQQMKQLSLRSTARLAGLLYLIIIVAGLFAQMAVRERLIVADNAIATAGNIMAAEGSFRAGIAADLVMIISDVALALAFFVLLRPVSHALSLLAALFRLTQAAILGVNLLNLFYALQLLDAARSSSEVAAQPLYAQMLRFLEAHGIGYSLGLVFFGVNCLIVGYLVFRSGYLPKVLGVLLVIAGASYLIDSFAKVLMVDYAAYRGIFDMILIPLEVSAELAMCLWLLIKGVKSEPQDSSVGARRLAGHDTQQLFKKGEQHV